jgi:hypothetical protein
VVFKGSKNKYSVEISMALHPTIKKKKNPYINQNGRIIELMSSNNPA